MKKLYKFYADCGRMGDIEGLFIADSKVVEAAIGEYMYFGEILGKHSEVYGDLAADEISVKSSDQKFIKQLEDLLGSSVSGYNPLDYLRCRECSEEAAYCECDW